MSRVVVTGAGGFIGRGVVRALAAAGYEVTRIVRSERAGKERPASAETVTIPGLVEGQAAFAQACRGAGMIVHLADNPDRTGGGSSPDLARVVARAAKEGGVPRIVFASSIYASLDEQGRANAYGAGKRAAEALLRDTPGVDVVSLRLPPVYGPGGKGGFAMIAKLVSRGWPLPFGSARAQRAYLSRDNLAALIVALADTGHDSFRAAAARVWEPSDVAVSTADLVRAIAAAMGKKPVLLPAPPAPLVALAALAGKREWGEAVFSPLACADDEELRDLTGWQPSRGLAANLAWLGEERG